MPKAKTERNAPRNSPMVPAVWSPGSSRSSSTKASTSFGKPPRKLNLGLVKPKAKSRRSPSLNELQLPIPARPSDIGNILVMGNGDGGQLGLGDDIKEVYKYTFLKALQNLPIVSVVAGGMHNLALDKDGTVYSWGCNDEGALGRVVPDGQENHAAAIPNSSQYKFVKLAAGDSISFGLTEDGQIYGWGTFRGGDSGVIGFTPTIHKAVTPTLLDSKIFSQHRWVDIAAGNNHALALTSTGVVYGWGSTQQFQAGFRKHHVLDGLNPQAVRFGTRRPSVKIHAVGCGREHSFGIDEDGELWTFGLNNYGQCGSSAHEETISQPMLVPLPKDCKAVAACGGEHFSMVLLDNGKVATFGKSADGQLGLGQFVNIDDKTSQLTATKFYTKVLPPGSKHDWVEQELTPHISQPQLVNALPSTISRIAAGGNHAFAVTSTGQAWRWGFNDQGQCSTGTNVADDEATDDLFEPLPIDMSKSKSIVLGVACGAQHSVMLVHTPPK